MDLEREDNALALVANIPILGMKERESELNTAEVQKDNEPDTEKPNEEQQTEKDTTEEDDSN